MIQKNIYDVVTAATARKFLDKFIGPCVNRPRRVDKPLVLYGAGDLGKMAYEYFNAIGISVTRVVDRNADLLSSSSIWKNTIVTKPDDVTSDLKNNSLLAVCIATAPYVPVLESLKKAGWKDIVHFYDIAEAYRNIHPLSNGWFSEEISKRDFDEISKVLERWDDDISRAHYLQFLAWRCLREEWIFEQAPVTQDNRYFIPEILSILTGNEEYVDIGAHHGKTVTKFVETVSNHCKKIWAIEPDPQNLVELKRCLLDLDESIEINILPFAVGDNENDERFYSGLGYASQFFENATESVTTTTIDNLSIAPTFMKFHLEGHELKALQGSIKTIQKSRPIIVLTAYHNELGIWRLPAWLHVNLPDYKLLFRMHSWVGTGAVIYAIPVERNIAH